MKTIPSVISVYVELFHREIAVVYRATVCVLVSLGSSLACLLDFPTSVVHPTLSEQ